MSVSSMTNAAIARRPDFHPLGEVPEGFDGIAQILAGPPRKPQFGAAQPMTGQEGVAAGPAQGGRQSNQQASNGATNALQVIAAYIPTEVLTLYVACIAAIHKANTVSSGEWVTLWCFLAATPVIVWIVYATKVKSAGRTLPIKPRQWPVWEMCAATIAYVAWAYALPETPFSEFGSYSSALAGVFVLIVSTMLGLLAPLFQRPLAT